MTKGEQVASATIRSATDKYLVEWYVPGSSSGMISGFNTSPQMDVIYESGNAAYGFGPWTGGIRGDYSWFIRGTFDEDIYMSGRESSLAAARQAIVAKVTEMFVAAYPERPIPKTIERYG